MIGPDREGDHVSENHCQHEHWRIPDNPRVRWFPQSYNRLWFGLHNPNSLSLDSQILSPTNGPFWAISDYTNNLAYTIFAKTLRR